MRTFICLGDNLKRLYDLEPGEVSLVPRGAVQRKFLVLKSENGAEMHKKEVLALLRKEPESMKKVEEIFKSAGEGVVSEADQEILKAAVCLLSASKASPELLAQVLKAAMKKDQDEDEEDDGQDGGNDDEDDDKPLPKKTKKTKKSDCKKSEETPLADKIEKEDILKSALAALPEETRKHLEPIFKAQEAVNKEAVEKAEALGRELTAVRRVNVKKEMVAKAESFKSLGAPIEELAETLLVLKEESPTSFDKVEKILAAANEQIAKGELFKEFGSNLPGATKTTWEMIEKAAESHVAKSGEKVSKAEATTRFLETADGKSMYNAYMNDHASNRR